MHSLKTGNLNLCIRNVRILKYYRNKCRSRWHSNTVTISFTVSFVSATMSSLECKSMTSSLTFCFNLQWLDFHWFNKSEVNKTKKKVMKHEKNVN